MSALRVAYLGPAASYTHQAATKAFPEQDGRAPKLEPRTTIEDVFAAVQDGEVDRAVVPFENSSNGAVIFTLDLFADAAGRNPDISVAAEVYLDVHHCLVGRVATDSPATATSTSAATADTTADTTNTKDSTTGSTAQSSPAPPDHTLTHIRKLISHPQAWGQCKAFLHARLKGVERQDASSTSRAAELAAADPSGATAAVSSRLAAELNGLHVLADGIEDHRGNSTRFFVLRRRRRQAGDGVQGGRSQDGASGDDGDDHDDDDDDDDNNDDHDDDRPPFKTMVSFTVAHAAPGALADALAVFKKHGLNLTSINTRPRGQVPWTYVFFVEFWGREGKRGKAGRVRDALAELRGATDAYRWLGSWESALGEHPSLAAGDAC